MPVNVKELSVSARRQEKGLTLLEIMIVLMITGFVSGGVLMVISGIMSNNSRNLAHMMAVKQVENAVHWISQDVQMAQSVSIGGAGGFPFTVTWTDWNNRQYQVTYNLDSSGLQRVYTETVGGVEVNRITIMVAKYIVLDPAQTFCDYADSVFDLTLTAEVNNIAGSTETRVVSIRPRPV